MSKDTDLTNEALSFIKDNSTTDGNTRAMTMGNYVNFTTQQGVTREVLDRVKAVDTAVQKAAILAAKDDLVEQIKTARKAGDDLTGLSNVVRISTVTGNIKATVESERTFPVPPREKGGERSSVTHHGHITLKVGVASSVVSSVEDGVSATIKEAMGIK